MSKSILIAEDETLIADLYQKEMARHGVTATVVKNGSEAWEALQKKAYDLLLVDLLMPVMDGYELLEKLREQEHPPVVVLTNLSEDVTTEKCHSLGADMCLFKSDLDAADVWERVKQFIGE